MLEVRKGNLLKPGGYKIGNLDLPKLSHFDPKKIQFWTPKTAKFEVPNCQIWGPKIAKFREKLYSLNPDYTGIIFPGNKEYKTLLCF